MDIYSSLISQTSWENHKDLSIYQMLGTIKVSFLLCGKILLEGLILDLKLIKITI